MRSTLTAIGLASLASLAGAQGYSADFESPDYVLGPLESQTIWTSWTGTMTALSQVVNTQNHTPGGSQSIEISDGADTVADFDALPGGSFDTGRWILSIQTLVPTGSIGSHECLVMNSWDLVGNYEWNGWVTLNASNAQAIANTPDGVFPTALIFDVWTEVRFEYDLDANVVDVYYNDVFLHTYDPRCGTTVGCANYPASAIDAVDLYPDPATAPTPIFYDDLLVEPGGPIPVGSPYCFGDGSGASCPCGNVGGAGEGCANGTGAGGTLAALGSTSVAADDAVFSGSGLPLNQPGLLFYGDSMIAGGSGVAFGDGLRCAGTNVIRRGTMAADGAGDASWGPGLLAGTSVTAGDTKFWQLWYRDPMGSACGNGFNLTNGYAVTYAP